MVRFLTSLVATTWCAWLVALSAAQLSALANMPIPEYTADLQRRIKRSWFPPKGEESKTVVVDFTVKSNGDLSQLKVVKSSGSAAADKAALKAVKMASPFKVLPAGSPATMSWEYKFDYDHFRGVSKSASGLHAVKESGSGEKPPAATAGAK